MRFVVQMTRHVRIFCVPMMLSAGALLAQEPAAPAQPGGEPIQALTTAVEQQSRKIDALTQQVAKLAQLIESGRATSTTPSAPMEPAPAVSVSPAMESPKAEPVDPALSGPRHVVAKGETLTSIAKHYKVGVADLLKVNKIADDRKLQIGQNLVIPKTPETPQKENQ